MDDQLLAIVKEAELDTIHSPLQRKANVVQFSEREIEAIRLLAQDYTTSKIALTLDMTLAQAQVCISSALNKTRLSSRLGLVVYALKHGIISLDEITLQYQRY